MERIIVFLTLLVTAFAWAKIYLVSFHRSMPPSYKIALFTLVAGTLIVSELYGFSPHVSLVVCTLLSAVLTWLSGSCKTPIALLIVQNIAVIMAVKAFYLFVSAVNVVLLRLIQGDANRDVVAIMDLILLAFSGLFVQRFVGGKGLNSLLHKYSTTVIIIAGLFFLPSYAMIRGDNLLDKVFKRYVIVSCGVLFLILLVWCVNDSKRQEGISELQEQLLQMRRNAHRFRELIPAIETKLIALYNDIQKFDSDDLTDDFQRTIDEVSALRNAYGIEAQKEFIQSQTFETTGILLLDSQLQDEQRRALANSVVFEVIVTYPINCIVADGTLCQLDIQRIVGDLFRNSLSAVERGPGQGTILLTMGQTSNGYQLRISDSGEYFPPEGIARFGIRGVTTSGSGNGLADLLETISGCNGSVILEENSPGSSLFTKSITIMFDGMGKLKIKSFRSEISDMVFDIDTIVERNKNEEKKQCTR